VWCPRRMLAKQVTDAARGDGTQPPGKLSDASVSARPVDVFRDGRLPGGTSFLPGAR
jgi:hypothetical protein